MKKIISILLVLALTLMGLCGCTKEEGNTDNKSSEATGVEVDPNDKNLNIVGDIASLKTVTAKESFASARTFTEGKAVPWTFDNTYFKLKNKKELNIAYTGGSVTVGTGGDMKKDCWRVYLNNWFKEQYPDATINEIGAYIGATSSSWAIARFKREVIEKKPDLLFIEYSVNDIYTGLNGDTSASIMDGMIRSLNAAVPECEIVVISVPDNGTIDGSSMARDAHMNTAQYNGVLWLDMAVPLKEAMQKNGKGWKDYITDSVHPNPDGYKVYADYIEKVLSEKLSECEKRDISGLVKHTVPEKPYTSNSNLKNQTLWFEDLKFDDTMWRKGSTMKKLYFAGQYPTLRSKEVGATLTFQFEGCSFAVFGDFKKGADVKFTLDGGNETAIGMAKDNSGENLIYDNLAPGVKHTVTMTVEGKGLCGLVAVYMG
ncbi:MAG: SGNH/GDSL hydrolase family protein [Clostridiales bacterium]|nr:SGNH/GDSL hydrolase family protein [Candidatus Equinaster intestinalis]